MSLRRPAAAVCAAILLLIPQRAPALSVLTHEAIIDSAWQDTLQPLIKARFPYVTTDELTKAHGYAYAGSIIQDMGYYPFGNRFFTDLLHYVHSGDFVMNLIRDSADVDEYAFALGALAHYLGDNLGHEHAVNPSVGLEYPRLERKYGPKVTYEDDPTAHLKVEFAFDVLQVSRGNYAPQAYHDFIGFEVALPLLERAFRETYGLEMTDYFGDLDLSLGTFRHTVSSLIPKATRIAWNLNKGKLTAANPSVSQRQFIYNLSRASYRKEWGIGYRNPTITEDILAFLIRILPKIGPLKVLAFRAPTPQTEKLFEESFNQMLSRYGTELAEQRRGALRLANRDCDTGAVTRPTEYRLADMAYARLAVELAKKDPASIDPALRKDVVEFFRDRSLPYAVKKDKKLWKQTETSLQKLQ